MDRYKFVEIVLLAEKNGYKDHLEWLPVLPLTKSSADDLLSKLLWQRRYEIIFSHNFAKAIFNESVVIDTEDGEKTAVFWHFHLRYMVVEEDPLQYLEDYCNG